MRRTALIAVGGNALIRWSDLADRDQKHHAADVASGIAEVVGQGWRVIVTHGNGPQVGAALLRSERSAPDVYPLPLDVCVATTQGEVGYLLEQALSDALARAGLHVPVATVLTEVVVARDDPAFARPTKPIGRFYTEEEAAARTRESGWQMVHDPAHGFRRVVPSPEPLAVVEEDAIRALVDAGVLVIAAGGGGIPVVREGQRLTGIEAVIDKDRASALLARRLGVDLLVLATDVDRAYLDYGQPSQRPLDRVTSDALARYFRRGHFAPGSMGPKIEAALAFVGRPGREAVVTSGERLADAVRGIAGTRIVPAQRRPARAHIPHDPTHEDHHDHGHLSRPGRTVRRA
jgi:carbamate kinase